jgi:ribosomal protein L24E
MRRRHCAIALLLCGLLCTVAVLHGGQTSESKEALQELQDFIGGWKGNGTLEKSKTAIWKEQCNWGWRFKGADSWLVIEFKESKFFKGGDLKYLTDKKRFQLDIKDKKDNQLVFTGEKKKKYLILERLDPDSKETQQIKMYLAAGGDRLIIDYLVKPENRTVFTNDWQIALTREGVSLGSSKKQPECVVTGGLGTMTVSHKGQTYYVCCSGCRDAFNENPEKIIKEYEAKKKAGK